MSLDGWIPAHSDTFIVNESIVFILSLYSWQHFRTPVQYLSSPQLWHLCAYLQLMLNLVLSSLQCNTAVCLGVDSSGCQAMVTCLILCDKIIFLHYYDSLLYAFLDVVLQKSSLYYFLRSHTVYCRQWFLWSVSNPQLNIKLSGVCTSAVSCWRCSRC